MIFKNEIKKWKISENSLSKILILGINDRG